MAYILRKSLYLSTKINKYYPNLSRTLTTSKSLAGNYEGDGKTTVTILNREHKNLILINSYSSLGFRLSNGIFAIGPIAAFPKTVLQWAINSVADITAESLSLFCLLQPKLDILVIGTGDEKVLLRSDVMEYLKANQITAEVLPTVQACTTFNFLNVEGRCIAGAFIPPKKIVIYTEEQFIMDNVEAINDFSVVDHGKIKS